MPLHCLHTHHTHSTGTRQRTLEDVLWYFYGIGERGGVDSVFFACCEAPADSDGRPTAGAQVLVRVPMVP